MRRLKTPIGRVFTNTVSVSGDMELVANLTDDFLTGPDWRQTYFPSNTTDAVDGAGPDNDG